MLTELRVENLGVIAELDLVLNPGLTVVTGETGAGKTLVVTAIELLVGGRADPSMVRAGSAEARVEGRVVAGDEEHVLARVVPADGRSRAYVDGRLATVGQLAELGARLVDLHGQHAHQSLLATATQRAALDRFGAVDLSALQAARDRLAAVEAALAALGGDARARAREVDLLRFQVGEIDAARVTDPAEEDTLEALEDRLAGAAAHREAGLAALEHLAGDGGAGDRLRAALAALGARHPFGPLAEQLRSLVSVADELAHDLRAAVEAIEEDPEQLAAVRARRQQLRDLRRKYGDTLADVLRFRDEAGERLATLERHDEEVARLEADRAAAQAAVAAAADAVAAARAAAAPALAAAVEAHLASLALPAARVRVEVGGPPPGDDVCFLVATNPGEPFLPLAKVASGGELARLMLALRLVLTQAPDTLVFDEVDAGIGGETGLAVGAALAALGARHQVLVVTHLAQVAAFADHHVVVAKHRAGGRTVARAVPVTGDDRLRELSRMLSGMADSESGRRHATDLLRAAGKG